jgi:hypothetical protein
MFLTADELAEWTGYKRPSAQMRWLRDNGLPFMVGGDGLPKVLRRAVEARLGAPSLPVVAEPRLRLA